MAKKTIKGKIIRIVDNRTVIINLGKKDGVTDKSYFQIVGESEDIVDPFTKEKLGAVNIVKANLKASNTFEKFTIATTKWETTSLKFQSSLAQQMQDFIKTEEIDEGELKVDESEIQPWKAKSELPVRLGDTVTVDVEETENNN